MYETSVHGKDDISVLCKFMTLIGFPVLAPQVRDIQKSVSEMKNFQSEVSKQVFSLKAENELLKKKNSWFRNDQM